MKNGNPNHPKKGDRITVDPIRKIKDIKAISKLTADNPRDHLLFIMGINNGLRAGEPTPCGEMAREKEKQPKSAESQTRSKKACP